MLLAERPREGYVSLSNTKTKKKKIQHNKEVLLDNTGWRNPLEGVDTGRQAPSSFVYAQQLRH